MVSGGYSYSMSGPTVTIACKTCRDLFDVKLWANEDAQRVYDEAVKAGTPVWELDTVPRCPTRKSHVVGIWFDPGPCPRCGTLMTQGDSGPLTD